MKNDDLRIKPYLDSDLLYIPYSNENGIETFLSISYISNTAESCLKIHNTQEFQDFLRALLLRNHPTIKH